MVLMSEPEGRPAAVCSSDCTRPQKPQTQTAQFVCLSVLSVHHLYPRVWNYLIFPIQFDAVSHS